MLSVHAAGDRVLELEQVTSVTQIRLAQQSTALVHASGPLREYIVALLARTRADPRVELGASPRAGLMLLRAAKANAALEGRDHALPDDVQALAQAVLAHRLLPVASAVGVRREQLVADALAAVPAL